MHNKKEEKIKDDKKARKFATLISMTLLTLIVAAAMCSSASAATETEIQQAIDNGTAWLAAQQNPDGSWGKL